MELQLKEEEVDQVVHKEVQAMALQPVVVHLQIQEQGLQTLVVAVVEVQALQEELVEQVDLELL
tara:strand:- start:33 stop:224 length:192 start_codon:yes stop_codon:yes gene_type:complete